MKRGFTLFELLVAISIVGIVTALVSVNFSVAQKKARDSRRVQDMESIRKAAEQYYSLAGYVYPATTALSDWTTGGQAVLEAFPVDPKGVGWTGYLYSVGTTYCACAAVENVSSGNSTDNNCTFGTGITGPFYCVKSQQ